MILKSKTIYFYLLLQIIVNEMEHKHFIKSKSLPPRLSVIPFLSK
jgi:hypothetical protein